MSKFASRSLTQMTALSPAITGTDKQWEWLPVLQCAGPDVDALRLAWHHVHPGVYSRLSR